MSSLKGRSGRGAGGVGRVERPRAGAGREAPRTITRAGAPSPRAGSRRRTRPTTLPSRDRLIKSGHDREFVHPVEVFRLRNRSVVEAELLDAEPDSERPVLDFADVVVQ